MAAPRLRTAPAGPGQIVETGTGLRQGLWQSFSVSDGLLSAIIADVVQAREGQLWFGTREGLSRYDGQGFVTFTTADGLADNNVQAILEDRQGHLWLGTRGGLSR